MNKAALLPALGMLGLLAYLMGSRKTDSKIASPATPVISAAEQKGRQLTKLPSSIEYAEEAPGRYVYKIKGIYNPLKRTRISDDIAPVYRSIVPSCTEFEINYQDESSTIITSRRLEFSELAFALDEIAQLGGELPTYPELEARDIPRSPRSAEFQYSVSSGVPTESDNLQWEKMPENGGELRLPITYGGEKNGTLFIVPATAHCMVHSRFVIRILDDAGLLLWMDGETGYGTIDVALGDLDKDDVHEIYLFRNNHGMEDTFQIRRIDNIPSN